jgi:ATP-dependent Clp protease protease subunit
MSQSTSYIILSQAIDMNVAQRLVNLVLDRLRAGKTSIVVLISSPGGQVAGGMAIYNFLKGLPAEVITHNFGQADSIAVTIFCAGAKRYCTPDSRFLIHGIGFNVGQGERFDERSIGERLEALKNERLTISKIISENSKRTTKEIEDDMFKGVIWTPEQAVANGLVHQIKKELFEKGADVVQL